MNHPYPRILTQSYSIGITQLVFHWKVQKNGPQSLLAYLRGRNQKLLRPTTLDIAIWFTKRRKNKRNFGFVYRCATVYGMFVREEVQEENSLEFPDPFILIVIFASILTKFFFLTNHLLAPLPPFSHSPPTDVLIV